MASDQLVHLPVDAVLLPTSALLPAASIASLTVASRKLNGTLRSIYDSLCRPAVARSRLVEAAEVLRRGMRGQPWAEPRKQRTAAAAIAQAESGVAQCIDLLLQGRALLAQGINPIAGKEMPDVVAAAAWSALLVDSSMDLRRVMAAALGKLGSAAVPHAAALAALMRDAWPEVRLAAAEALGLLGPSASVSAPAVATALRDPCPHVCAKAVEALGRLGASAATHSAELLGDRDRYVRARAAAALGRLGSDAAMQVSQLAPLLNDSHESVQATARQALARICGVDSKFLAIGVAAVPRKDPPEVAQAATLLSQTRSRARASKWDVGCRAGDDADESSLQWQAARNGMRHPGYHVAQPPTKQQRLNSSAVSSGY